MISKFKILHYKIQFKNILIFRSGWFFVDQKIRPLIFFPGLKFPNVKSIEKATDFDERNLSYYWFQDIPPGIQAEYREVYKVVAYCDFEFSSFPFETLLCNVTYRSSQSSSKWTSLMKPEMYVAYDSEEMDIAPVKANLPFEIWAKKLDPFYVSDGGLKYSSTGISFTIRRNNLGLLISRFYGPMAIFAMLSMLSYNINVEVVSSYVLIISSKTSDL